MTYTTHVDLHMHSNISDGSDSPEELLAKVKEAGIEMFALTDHDDVRGCIRVLNALKDGDPRFITGIEFSCVDEEGKYHILGYGYDINAAPINDTVSRVHEYRMSKARARVDAVRNDYGFDIPEEEIDGFLSLPNPGKPHLANLLIKHGYAQSREQAFRDILDKIPFKAQYIRPEEAIDAILKSGGIPVLAHPVYGSGDQLILGEEMEERLKRLIGFGLKGVEAFYSGFTFKMTDQMLSLADRFGLYVTAGSDYHGTNKMIPLGDNGIEDACLPQGMKNFLDLFGG